jgi:uncharacterized membrane protein
VAAGRKPSVWTRPWRRVFRPFLNPDEKARIAKAIADMERGTTGEIHVHVIGRTRGHDPLELARHLFHKLGLHQTDGRNGVLILVSHLDHRFAIWGDEGVHAKAGQPLWERAKKVLLEEFSRRRYAAGIEACVREVGRELASQFSKNEPGPGKNQLPDDVTGS